MHCSACVAHVKEALESVTGVQSATIQLEAPQGRIKGRGPIELGQLQSSLRAIGDYSIREHVYAPPFEAGPAMLPDRSLATYKPLLLIVSFITGVSLLAQYPFADFSGHLWMRHFMAGFFIVFAFFKLLDIKAFAASYRMYDIVAARWPVWARLYPFIELALGILYLTGISPIFSNAVTLVVLGVSSIGVIKSQLAGRQIKCACLGTIFNLPMSSVTIVEDLTMTAMAGLSLVILL